ncbi:MAG: hypothetical protein M1820_001806 [Bogoriella megaspora]|nr:MAG: hypothetical protein M1820_001806 [Bogoriella megaspora]
MWRSKRSFDSGDDGLTVPDFPVFASENAPAASGTYLEVPIILDQSGRSISTHTAGTAGIANYRSRSPSRFAPTNPFRGLALRRKELNSAHRDIQQPNRDINGPDPDALVDLHAQQPQHADSLHTSEDKRGLHRQITHAERNESLRRRSLAQQHKSLLKPEASSIYPSASRNSGRSQKAHMIEQMTCQDCEHESIVYECNICKIRLCNICWPRQLVHKNGAPGPRGDPHEKTEVSVAAKVRKVLTPLSDPVAREKLHQDDEQTTWFGIERPHGGLPLFQDFGRYGDLIENTNEGIKNAWEPIANPTVRQSSTDSRRTPSLVSFVGQTGAGKSALIKLLIDLYVEYEEQYSTPVVESSSVTAPTSEDVHLYIEPRTAFSKEPILFADCEGLEGGEREPVSAKIRRIRRSEKAPSVNSPGCRSRAARLLSERELAWAEAGKTKSREYAVTNLYPRLLYTFSDVIVFVLRNQKVIEGVFTKLVDWAAAALETSSNQPVLPHAIIILNASDSSPKADWWDMETCTRQILDELSKTVSKNPTFSKYAQQWLDRGHQIETVQQLMETYYRSVQIIRIPHDGRPRLVQEQMDKLYSVIDAACNESRARKFELRMLLDAEELQSYLQFAFDHFARTLDRPFDFVQASFTNSPIPSSFGGNILKLAINIMEAWENQVDATTIFEELSYMVASCIVFDCSRKKIVGTPEKIFPQYLDHLDTALENFAERHWPCEYVKKGGGGRCVNVRSGHSKGHQLKNGQVLAIGDYVSRFSYENSQHAFRNNVYYFLEQLLNRLQASVRSGGIPVIAAAQIHRDAVMADFYRHISRGEDLGFNSHTNIRYLVDTSSAPRVFEHMAGTDRAPLLRWRNARSKPGQIKDINDGASILNPRLLGGGIRGIVELEILRLIEEAMGGNLPISIFFDLIVGTSTGGLIALGLGARNWSVDKCIDRFQSLCHAAFTRRSGSEVPIIGWLVDNYNHSRYETSPLEKALQKAFSKDEFLFGGRRPAQYSGSFTKVAVIATSAATGNPMVLSNYNRPDSEKFSYHFQRPARVLSELKIWEAARATSAAPRYFKPFHHEPSKNVFLDGGIWHNNPITIAEAERKMIWSNMSEMSPDIVLSIGTATSPQLRKTAKEKVPVVPPVGVISHGKQLLKIAKDHVASSLNCEKTWDDFLGHVPKSMDWSRFIRINPELNMNIPALDEVQSLETLRAAVVARMTEHMDIVKVASKIACRLPQESHVVKELGKAIKNRVQGANFPFFTIHEEGQSIQSFQRVPITKEAIDAMVRKGQFHTRVVQITLANRLAASHVKLWIGKDYYHISGSPRVLNDDDKLQSAARPSVTSNPNRWAARTHSFKTRHSTWLRSKSRAEERFQNRPLEAFTESTHVLGYASAQEVKAMTNLLTNGPSPVAPPGETGITGALRALGRNVRKLNLKPTTRRSQNHENAYELEASMPPVDGYFAPFNDHYDWTSYVPNELEANSPVHKFGSSRGMLEIDGLHEMTEDGLHEMMGDLPSTASNAGDIAPDEDAI